MKYYTIYQITNLVNSKIYIGMHETNNIKDNYFGSGKRITRSIRYYGKDKFKKSILFVFDNKEEMIAKEIELVNEEFINRKDTYNLMLGGQGGKSYDNKETRKQCGLTTNSTYWKIPENKRKRDEWLAEYNANNWKNGVYKRDKENNPFFNKSHTIESKKKMSLSQQGKQTGCLNSQYGKCWITNGKESKKIFKGDHIPEGWRLGRKMKD